MWKNAEATFALHAGQLRLHKYTQKMQYSLLFHGKNSYANAPQCTVISTSTLRLLLYDMDINRHICVKLVHVLLKHTIYVTASRTT